MIYPGSRPAGVTTRRPIIVTESLLTRSMLIKIFMVCACIWTHAQGGMEGGEVSSGELTVHGSRFAVHCSRFTVHDSQFTVHSSRFTISRSTM